MQVGDEVTQLIGGIMPTPVRITRIEMLTGIIHCADIRFCPETGMELDEEKEWGPKYEKTGSYLKEVLDYQAAVRKELRALRTVIDTEESA